MNGRHVMTLLSAQKNIVVVEAILDENSNVYIRQHVQQLNFCLSCLYLRTRIQFYRKNLFSNEVLFWLNRFINKLNCQSSEDPREIREKPLQPENRTVCCGLKSKMMLDRYRAIITNFIVLQFDNVE